MNATIQTLTAGNHLNGVSILLDIVDRISRCVERSRQRHHLSALSSRELEDIGVSANAAATEAAKPFWKV